MSDAVNHECHKHVPPESSRHPIAREVRKVKKRRDAPASAP
jgi:hypothetical protein